MFISYFRIGSDPGHASSTLLGAAMRILIAEHTELFLEGLKVVLQRLDGRVSVTACDAFANALEEAKYAKPPPLAGV